MNTNVKDEVLKYAQRIEEIKIRKANYTSELISVLKQEKNQLNSDFMEWLYWETEFSLEMIAEIMDIPFRNITRLTPSHNVPYICHGCKETRYKNCTSRTDRAAFLAPKNLNSHLCEECTEAWRKLTEERETKIIQAQEEKAKIKSKFLHEMPYDEFLRTTYWKKFAKERMREVGYKCTKCGRSDLVLNVHHLTYERRGYERVSDVEVLCKACHLEAHNMPVPQCMIQNPVSLRDRALEAIRR